MSPRSDNRHLIEMARIADAACATGSYCAADGSSVSIADHLAQSLAGTRLIVPDDWAGIHEQARRRCAADRPRAQLAVISETTLASLRRLSVTEGLANVAALNFASARNPGGGYRTGAIAQEETLARASGLVPTLELCQRYYQANRATTSLLYTDHAIWSPLVPIFADDEGSLSPAPYQAGFITMPAPNVGAMKTESDLLQAPTVLSRRIRQVLALAIAMGVDHLILGAWGCGAFGNDPGIVARRFADALAPGEPWRGGLASITFAIHDTSRRRASLATFRSILAPGDPQQVVTMFRPTGPKELALVRSSGFRRWPPRLAGQPIFYPVTNRDYAAQIAQEWNVAESGFGCVTRFHVRKSFMDRYQIHTVGGSNHTEWWIPAEDLEALNDHIIGDIEVIETFGNEPGGS